METRWVRFGRRVLVLLSLAISAWFLAHGMTVLVADRLLPPSIRMQTRDGPALPDPPGSSVLAQSILDSGLFAREEAASNTTTAPPIVGANKGCEGLRLIGVARGTSGTGRVLIQLEDQTALLTLDAAEGSLTLVALGAREARVRLDAQTTCDLAMSGASARLL